MTSIEWFYNEIKHIIPNDFLGKYEEAKEMHKQEIIDAYDLGSLSDMQYPNPKTVIKNGEQYYQETFKKFTLIDETPSAPASDSTVMIKQETLYTEEDMIRCWKFASIDNHQVFGDQIGDNYKSFIQSLKQPKQ